MSNEGWMRHNEERFLNDKADEKLCHRCGKDSCDCEDVDLLTPIE